jgi:hypothetical protein
LTTGTGAGFFFRSPVTDAAGGTGLGTVAEFTEGSGGPVGRGFLWPVRLAF